MPTKPKCPNDYAEFWLGEAKARKRAADSLREQGFKEAVHLDLKSAQASLRALGAQAALTCERDEPLRASFERLQRHMVVDGELPEEHEAIQILDQMADYATDQRPDHQATHWTLSFPDAAKTGRAAGRILSLAELTLAPQGELAFFARLKIEAARELARAEAIDHGTEPQAYEKASALHGALHLAIDASAMEAGQPSWHLGAGFERSCKRLTAAVPELARHQGAMDVLDMSLRQMRLPRDEEGVGRDALFERLVRDTRSLMTELGTLEPRPEPAPEFG